MSLNKHLISSVVVLCSLQAPSILLTISIQPNLKRSINCYHMMKTVGWYIPQNELYVGSKLLLTSMHFVEASFLLI